MTSTPKYRAIPEQTPAIFRSSRGLVRVFAGLPVGEVNAFLAVAVPHWEQYRAASETSIPHELQNIITAYKKGNGKNQLEVPSLQTQPEP